MTDRPLIFRQPATRWEDALPTGNGSIGALVYGNIASELIVLNHERLWYPTAKLESPPIAKEMKKARELIATGAYREAQQLLLDTVHEMGYPHQLPIGRSGNPYHPHTANVSPSHPAFDIAINQPTTGPFTHYRRSLDPQTGEISVSWNVGEQSWQRRLFVSDADDVVVLELACPADQSVDAAIWLEQHHTPSRSWARLEDDVKENEPPITYTLTATGGAMTVVAEYDRGGEFGGVARVIATGGVVSAHESDGGAKPSLPIRLTHQYTTYGVLDVEERV